MEVLHAHCGEEWETVASESFVSLAVTRVAPRFTGPFTVARSMPWWP